jgi:hypothetical protein
MNLGCQGAKTKRLVVGSGYRGGYALNEDDGGVLLLRPTPAAGPEALALGVLSSAKEESVASERAASRASRSAIDLGGAYSKEKRAVRSGVAAKSGLPIKLGSLSGNGTWRSLL